jgi:hypothetical protein
MKPNRSRVFALHKIGLHKYLAALNRDRRRGFLPEAISPTIVPTVTRKPRMQGFPPMTSGLNVIRASSFTGMLLSGIDRSPITQIRRGGFMLITPNVTTTIVQTRPHPPATFRLPPVGYANGFITMLIETCVGYWWGWAGSDDG